MYNFPSRSEDMVENPSGTEGPLCCENCGDIIQTSEWHPVTMGDERIIPFCSQKCRLEWEEES